MTNALEKFEIYYATLIRGGSSFQLYCRVTFFPRKNGILKTESSREQEAYGDGYVKSKASGESHQQSEDCFQAKCHHCDDYLMGELSRCLLGYGFCL